MHHEGFVEAVTVQLPGLAVEYVDHRGLAEGGQQLVRGMGGEYQRPLFTGIHAVTAIVELVKGRVGVPGLVEMQHLDVVGQGALDQVGVVAQAVVGGIRDHRQLDLRRAPARQRVGGDLRLDRLAGELLQRNGSDDAQFVACGAHVQRNSTGHDDRVEDRLVTVAIDQYQVATRHHRMPDDLVCRRGAVDHEEGMIRAEIARGTGFRGGHRPGVIKQRTELRHRYGEIRAQRVFAEELMERLADRALAIGDPAVARRVPGVVDSPVCCTRARKNGGSRSSR